MVNLDLILENERYIAHMDKYKESDAAKRIIAQETSFVNAVEDFYGLHSGTQPAVNWALKLGEEEHEKIGTRPAELIDIINGFSEYPADSSKLDYESVREDYRRNNTLPRKITKGLITLAGIGASAYAIFFTKELSVGNSLLCGGIFGSMYSALIFYPAPKGTNHGLDQYIHLHDLAEKADKFMDQDYRKHFIKSSLMKDKKTYDEVKQDEKTRKA
jgi:hypothetical protein